MARFEQERELMVQMLEASDRAKREYREIDTEVWENYMVLPPGQSLWGRHAGGGGGMDVATLVDPETHTMVETLLAALMLSTIGERGFVSTEPVGREDAVSSRYAGKLLERNFRQRGNYRATYSTYKSALLLGAGVIFPRWRFETMPRTVRRLDIDPLTGETLDEELTIPEWPLWDDVEFISVDLDDLFYDPSRAEIHRMLYMGRRFTIARHEAEKLAEDGIWDREQVGRATRDTQHQRRDGRDDRRHRAGIDQPLEVDLPEAYGQLIGYEFHCETPWKPKDGNRNRRIVMLNEEIVESRANPSGITRKIPAYEFIVNPVAGSFRGVAPAAVARFTQGFLSGLLATTAEGIVRKTRNPVIFNKQLMPDPEKLEAWQGPIGVNGDPSGIRDIAYNPPLGDAFNLMQLFKQHLQRGSSAQEGLQGGGFGTKRLSATETQITFERQLSRPQLMAEMFERESLDPLGSGVFELNQRFIESEDDLAARIGRSNFDSRAPSLFDIDGDFDIRFSGSRRIKSREAQLEFLERSFQVLGAIPGAAPVYPWTEAILKWLELADLRDLEAKVADKAGVEDFIERSVAQGRQAQNGQNQPATPGPLGLAPAQAAGRAAV